LKSHPFILSPGEWIGEGKIVFSGSTDTLHFTTHWTVSPGHPKSGTAKEVECTQVVDIEGATDEKITNRFIFTDIHPDHFQIRLKNDLIGDVQGTGIIEENKFAWEFREELEGFEIYDLLEKEKYRFHAQYISPENYRSTIEGTIRKK